MALTKGQKAAIERAWDETAGFAICEYSRHWYSETVPGSAPHHVFGRARSDDPRHILCMSYELHTALHRSLPDSRGNPVTKERCEAVLAALHDDWVGLDETIERRSTDE